MEEKYLNEAIIGNKKMLATYTSKGELQRLYFPSRENRQYISFFRTGVKVNNSDLIYLHDDINNVYKQYYDTDTNVLNTEVTNTYFNLTILQTDCALIKEDNVLLKKYTFINDSKIDLDIEFFIHAELLSNENNHVSCKVIDNGMFQYAHDFVVSTFAKDYKINKHQIHGSKETIKRAEIYDKDYIGMSKDSSISYKIGVIHPNEKKTIEICVMVDENKNISAIEDEVDRIRRKDLNKECVATRSYWRKYLKAHNGLNLKEQKDWIKITRRWTTYWDEENFNHEYAFIDIYYDFNGKLIPSPLKGEPYQFKGKINGRYAVTMHLSIWNDKIYGEYYYDRNGSENVLYLYGGISSGRDIVLLEFNDKGEQTSTFNGKFGRDSFSGTFVNYQNKEMPFELYLK